MKSTKDNECIQLNNADLEVAMQTTLGDRDDQQDCFGADVSEHRGLFVVCDGMGGHTGGKEASNVAIASILEDYVPFRDQHVTSDTLQAFLRHAHENVTTLSGHGGTTCVLVYIHRNKLYWCSAGDSRAYIMRDGQFIQLTQDHNYKTVLDGKLASGLITQEEYAAEYERGEALINYLGMPGMNLLDYNSEPLVLRSNDVIIIMSDGLYKFASDEEIFRLIANFNNPADAVIALERKMEKNKQLICQRRDNATIGIIKVK